jgi:hypothetical protein
MMANFASIVLPRATTSKAVAAPQTSVINSRRRIASSTVQDQVAAQTSALEDVRFGSEVDMCGATAHVRFTLNSDRESGLSQRRMSALPPKADLCSATRDVRFGAIS